MTVKMTRYGVVALVVIVLIALGGFAAACGGDDATTTTGSGSTDTTAASTGSTTNETTIVEGGKSLDDYRAEIPALEKAVAANPKDVQSWQDLAVAHYQLSEYEQAVADYQKMLALSPSAFGHNNLGNVYRDWKKYDEAINEYKTAISIDPTLKQPYINLAGLYKTQGDLKAALKILDDAKTVVNETDKSSVEKYQESLTSTTT